MKEKIRFASFGVYFIARVGCYGRQVQTTNWFSLRNYNEEQIYYQPWFMVSADINLNVHKSGLYSGKNFHDRFTSWILFVFPQRPCKYLVKRHHEFPRPVFVLHT